MAVTLTPVDIGTVPGDGTGDTPYVAFGSLNQNDTNLKAGVDLVLDVTQNRILGRASVGTGNPEHLTAAQVRSILNVEDGAAADQTAGEIEAIVSHDNLLDFSANEHIDWTLDQGATNIHPGNYVNTTDHTALSNIGTNTHVQIDTHLALTNEHIDWTAATASLDTSGTITVDTINEHSVNAGVTIENVVLEDATISNPLDEGQLLIYGGTVTTTGGNIALFGGTHAINANQIHFRVGLTSHLEYNGTNTWDFQANNITTTGSISGSNLSGTNTGDQTSIVGITGTIAQFNTALTDGSFATGGGTATGTNTGDQVSSDFTHDSLSGVNANEHIDWTVDDVSTIHSANIPKFPYVFGNEPGNIHFFVNDGGGNLGMRWNATAGATNTLVENGQAFELDISNDTDGGDWVLYYGTTSTGTAGDTITWSPAITVDGATGNVTFGGSISASNLSGTNTGDQTITLTGDVTGSGTGSFATAIANNVIGLPELTHQTAGQIIYYGASGVPALLNIGSTDQVLSVSGGLPSWQTVSGSDNNLEDAPTSDHTVSGLTSDMTVGESVVFGDLLYMKSDGKLWKADANAAATMPGMYMAAATIAANNAGSVLLQGFARDDTWAWTVGGLVYASGTLGAMTQTAPSASGDQVQVVGVATHADRLDFRPSPMMVELV